MCDDDLIIFFSRTIKKDWYEKICWEQPKLWPFSAWAPRGKAPCSDHHGFTSALCCRQMVRGRSEWCRLCHPNHWFFKLVLKPDIFSFWFRKDLAKKALSGQRLIVAEAPLSLFWDSMEFRFSMFFLLSQFWGFETCHAVESQIPLSTGWDDLKSGNLHLKSWQLERWVKEMVVAQSEAKIFLLVISHSLSPKSSTTRASFSCLKSALSKRPLELRLSRRPQSFGAKLSQSWSEFGCPMARDQELFVYTLLIIFSVNPVVYFLVSSRYGLTQHICNRACDKNWLSQRWASWAA